MDQTGEYWDLNKPNDVKELQEMLDYEEPYLLTGSPPCDPFSQLLKISSRRRDPSKVEQQRKIGVQNLHTSIKFYRNQYDNNRYFLHEHPESADSWDGAQMVALHNFPGVFTVMGPMCHWDMQVTDRSGHVGTPRKRTKWVTNSPILAKTLDVRCSNELGTEPFHVHLHKSMV